MQCNTAAQAVVVRAAAGDAGVGDVADAEGARDAVETRGTSACEAVRAVK